MLSKKKINDLKSRLYVLKKMAQTAEIIGYIAIIENELKKAVNVDNNIVNEDNEKTNKKVVIVKNSEHNWIEYSSGMFISNKQDILKLKSMVEITEIARKKYNFDYRNILIKGDSINNKVYMIAFKSKNDTVINAVDCSVVSDFEIVFDCKLFFDIISTLDKDNIYFSMNEDIFFIQNGNAEFKLKKMYKIEEMSALTIPKLRFSIEQSEFKSMLDIVIDGAEKRKDDPNHLNKVYFKIENDKLTIATTDQLQVRECISTINCMDTINEKIEMLIDTAIVNNLRNSLKDGDVYIDRHDNKAFFDYGSGSIVADVAFCRFPNYTVALKINSDCHEINIDTSLLKSTLKKALKHCHPESHGVKFTVSDSIMTIENLNGNTKYKEQIPVECAKEINNVFACNCKNFIEILNKLKTKTSILYIQNEKPVIIKGSGIKSYKHDVKIALLSFNLNKKEGK